MARARVQFNHLFRKNGLVFGLLCSLLVLLNFFEVAAHFQIKTVNSVRIRNIFLVYKYSKQEAIDLLGKGQNTIDQQNLTPILNRVEQIRALPSLKAQRQSIYPSESLALIRILDDLSRLTALTNLGPLKCQPCADILRPPQLI